jgi:type II secretory pathway pseudopilin PulG
VIVAVLIVLVIVGLLAYSSQKNDAEAQQKAQQLEQKFQAAGLAVPASHDDIVRTLGTDGGAICENPGTALGKAIFNDVLVNGADFVGRRPVVVDRRVVAGEAIVLQVYCPEKLQPYLDKVNKLKLRHTVKG